MKDRAKATIAALATMAVVAAAMALPALAQSGVDEAWTNDMNQSSYWEARFGGECTKFENHSGTVDASQAVVKDGNRVRVYNPSPSQVLGPANPANGKHFDPPHSWVITCMQTSSTSSTSTSSSSSTTSTTSTSQVTTTTPETTTSSTLPSSTSTSQPTTSTTPTEVLPLTGSDLVLYALAGLALALTGGGFIYLARTQE